MNLRALAGWVLCVAASSAQALDLSAAWPAATARTHLIELAQGSRLSSQAAQLGNGSYELAGGQVVRFDRWYSTKLPDSRITWMTQMAPQWGLLWGLSTGERGAKYAIAPGFKLGFVYTSRVTRSSVLSIKATTVLGGRLKEKTCTADYGDIGGVQTVNCRLAASEIPPEQTLQYLLNSRPLDQQQIAVRYTVQF